MPSNRKPLILLLIKKYISLSSYLRRQRLSFLLKKRRQPFLCLHQSLEIDRSRTFLCFLYNFYYFIKWLIISNIKYFYLFSIVPLMLYNDILKDAIILAF